MEESHLNAHFKICFPLGTSSGLSIFFNKYQFNHPFQIRAFLNSYSLIESILNPFQLADRLFFCISKLYNHRLISSTFLILQDSQPGSITASIFRTLNPVLYRFYSLELSTRLSASIKDPLLHRFYLGLSTRLSS